MNEPGAEPYRRIGGQKGGSRTMKVAVDQPDYLPWKGYFDLIHDVDLFVFYNDVQYTSRDWRSRNKIIGMGQRILISFTVNRCNDCNSFIS